VVTFPTALLYIITYFHTVQVIRSAADGVPGVLGLMNEDKRQANKDAYEGLHLVITYLMEKVDCKPGYKPKVHLRDIKVYRQVR
jgi:hypothetical protein